MHTDVPLLLARSARANLNGRNFDERLARGTLVMHGALCRGRFLEEVVENMARPRFLYKYMSLNYLEDVLTSHQLWFSSPNQFNDPLDCNLTIDTDYSDDPRAFEQILRQSAAEDLWFLDENTKEGSIRRLLTDPQVRTEAMQYMLKQYRESTGICCFSVLADNAPMWAHYAANHKGVCLQLDTIRDPQLFHIVEPVVYVDSFPRLRFRRFNDGEVMRKLVTTKTKRWSYEEEYRVFRKPPGLHEFDKTALSAFIFGHKATPETVQKYSNLIAEIGYPAAKHLFRIQVSTAVTGPKLGVRPLG